MFRIKTNSLFRKFLTVSILTFLLLAAILLVIFGVFLNYYWKENVKYNRLNISTTANFLVKSV